MPIQHYILILIVVVVDMCVAENKWAWSETKLNQKVRDYNPLQGNHQHARVDRDREPTTKRPLPGQPQNDDDIDDYSDGNDELSKQNSPYTPTGPLIGPSTTGNFNGFGNYPQFTGFLGNTPNGILVGPGGPTGIIGRPQTHYPVAGLTPYAGYPATQSLPGINANGSPGFSGYTGLSSNGLGQYPFVNSNNPQQFLGAQYPQTQFPGVHYPQQPQYTEGYGLTNLNPGFNANAQFNGNFNPDYSFNFDEYPVQAEGKTAHIETINKKVDDKVAKNLNKT